jgi:hypothetical protein
VSQRNVNETLRDTLNAMKRAGFVIDQDVSVVVDEKLPFMGYTSRQPQSHTIVVSGFSVKSGMLEGLLAHELSHVYRNITNHPSHNERIITHLAGSFSIRHKLDADYQREILHQVINHVQDLYADDISMKVLVNDESGLFDSKQLEEFFIEWIKEDPVKTSAARRDQWVNGAMMLSNCFALSNMQRHSIGDNKLRAKSKNDTFLRRINPQVAEKFRYFNDFMVGLREQVTDTEFIEEMEEYLENFFEVVTTMTIR